MHRRFVPLLWGMSSCISRQIWSAVLPTGSPLTSTPTLKELSLLCSKNSEDQREERLWTIRENQLCSELREYHDKVDYASQQADYEMEGLTREHRATLAKMTKDVDVMMAEVQEQTESMMASVSAQLKHET